MLMNIITITYRRDLDIYSVNTEYVRDVVNSNLLQCSIKLTIRTKFFEHFCSSKANGISSGLLQRIMLSNSYVRTLHTFFQKYFQPKNQI